MLSSLIGLIKALRLWWSGRLVLVSSEEPAAQPENPKEGRPARCRGDHGGTVEVVFHGDVGAGHPTHSVWIQVDARVLMERILENPDIDLDALQGIERPSQKTQMAWPPEADSPEPSAPNQPTPWHQKVAGITQAPPITARDGVRRRRPASSRAHH